MFSFLSPPSSTFSPHAFRQGRGEKVVAQRLQDHVQAAPTPHRSQAPRAAFAPRTGQRCSLVQTGLQRRAQAWGSSLVCKRLERGKRKAAPPDFRLSYGFFPKNDIERIGINGTEGRGLVWLWAPSVSGFVETQNSGFTVNLRQTRKGSSVFAVFTCRQFSGRRSGLLTGINPTEGKPAALSVNFKKD